MQFQETVELVGKTVDAAGVAVVVVGLAWASIVAAARLIQRRTEVYEQYRRLLGRSILLGLEFLVAGDIIRTVAIAPTFASVGVLGIIVIIRTFLSFSLELEITGRWPWQKRAPFDVTPVADSHEHAR
ncbi:MAG: DUF1622 domain-containing protein [Propionibacteriaceae bacterium]